MAAVANIRNYANTIEGTTGTYEIENQANTNCAGPSWKVYELNSAAWHRSQATTNRSQMCPWRSLQRCLCAWTLDSGQLIIWFGADFHCSLVNPHQIRLHGLMNLTATWMNNATIGDLWPGIPM